MDIETQLEKYAEKHLMEPFEIVTTSTGDHICIDCVWTVNGTEKRIRVRKSDPDSDPEVLKCSDYKDERSSFGLKVLNKRIAAETEEEHLEIALERMFSQMI
jgi:hypothetical protein